MEKTRIELPTDRYQKAKTASGGTSLHNGDRVAAALVGLTLEETQKLAAEVISTEKAPVTVEDLVAKYAHLNPGQQRMNLGNRIRGALAKLDKAYDAAVAKGEDAGFSGDTYLATIVEPFRQAVADRQAAAEAEKAAKQAERDAKAAEEKAAKDAKAAAKAETAEVPEAVE